jgi:molybdopterin-guanine dinucleotide biosynthesis protein A
VVALSGPSLVILAAGRARRYGGVKQLAPIGKHGEGVIDLLASDAWASGFDDIVIVVNADTGKQIEQHVAARWPKERKVSFAVQTKLRGTVDAVLAAESSLDLSKPFGVSNADDLYGRAKPFFCSASDSPPVPTTAWSASNSIARSSATYRCREAPAWSKTATHRHRRATQRPRHARGLRRRRRPRAGVALSARHRLDEPLGLPAFDHSAHAQVNLPAQLRNRLRAAVVDLRGAGPRDHETLVFEVLPTRSRCIGITHAKDLPVAQLLVRLEIESGHRPEYAFV